MNSEAASFEGEVRGKELDHINASREAAGVAAGDPLAGLALSGGGIRSATFNLGVLQALCEARKLRRFDYLSTVSGGGYIGGWLTAWIHRHGLDNVERELRESVSGAAPEPHEVRWLRAYSNFLTPRTGLLSLDTLWALFTYLRNLVTNQALLFVVIATVLIAGAGINAAILELSSDFPLEVWFTGAAAMLLAAPVLGFELALLRGQSPRPWAARPICWVQRHESHWVIAILSVLGATLMAYASAQEDFSWWVEHDRTLAVLLVGVFPAFWLIAGLTVPLLFEPSDDPAQASVIRPHWLWAAWLLMAAALFWALQSVYIHFMPGVTENREWLISLLGPTFLIVAFEVAILVLVALAGRTLRPYAHDWLSRMAAVIFLICLMPTAVFTTWLILVPSVDFIDGVAHAAISTMTLGWIATTLFGVIGAKSAATGKGTQPTWLARILPVAPFVFVLGLFTLLAWMTRGILLAYGDIPVPPEALSTATTWSGAFLRNILVMQAVPGETWALASAVFAALALLLAWRVDINLFSFHAYYRNRISQAYLAASARKRKANEFTRYAPSDSPALKDLDKTADGAALRPYPLINTALNLSGRARMEWQQRKAASFVFSPLYCGYELPPPLAENREGTACFEPDPREPVKAHRPTADFIRKDPGRNIAHALAITISGAAASPNMGYHTSPALAALMTAFNVRLGWWLSNPRHESAWSHGGPSFSIAWMMKELMANANEETRYVYLSDGGHFENLGVYELLRRRCKVIVASDASADASFLFDDLANLVHKARADLGVEIRADAADLRPVVEAGGVIGPSKVNYLLAQITYPGSDGTGWLVYVKSSLPAKLPADVENYRWTRPGFPHQSTADQSFDETQFEAYRRLGLEIGRAVVAGLDTPAIRLEIGW